MIVAGIGCGRGVRSEDIVRLIGTALASFGIARENLDAVATEASKAGEGGIASAVRSLSVRLIPCSLTDLEAVTDKIVTRSARVQALKGIPSIAEASALVAAGRNARLLGARIAANRITCAIAISEGP